MTSAGPEPVETEIVGLLEYALQPRRDRRGWLVRVADDTWAIPAREDIRWVQVSALRSFRGVLRGFHVRAELTEWKRIRVVSGQAFDVVVDLRPWSASFLQRVSFNLSGDEPKIIIIPPGCAHAIQALTSVLDFTLSVSVEYCHQVDRGFKWDDPTVGVTWPIIPPILSDRDANAFPLSAIRGSLSEWFCDNEGD